MSETGFGDPKYNTSSYTRYVVLRPLTITTGQSVSVYVDVADSGSTLVAVMQVGGVCILNLKAEVNATVNSIWAETSGGTCQMEKTVFLA